MKNARRSEHHEAQRHHEFKTTWFRNGQRLVSKMVSHCVEVRNIDDSIAVGIRAESVQLQTKFVADRIEVENIHNSVAVRVA